MHDLDYTFFVCVQKQKLNLSTWIDQSEFTNCIWIKC